jgi:hypothetical protein
MPPTAAFAQAPAVEQPSHPLYAEQADRAAIARA